MTDANKIETCERIEIIIIPDHVLLELLKLPYASGFIQYLSSKL